MTDYSASYKNMVAYCYNEENNVTAITQSDEQGENSAINIKYTCALPKEVFGGEKAEVIESSCLGIKTRTFQDEYGNMICEQTKKGEEEFKTQIAFKYDSQNRVVASGDSETGSVKKYNYKADVAQEIITSGGKGEYAFIPAMKGAMPMIHRVN